jgi:hypothetical protein
VPHARARYGSRAADPIPRASVVVPTRDRADVLPRALGSLLRQEGVEFEVVVVDDGSSDHTRDVVAALGDSRLRYLRQEPAGASAARNRGAGSARGDLLFFLDSDDEVRPSWLSALADALAEPGIAIACCGARALEPEGERDLPVRDLGPAFCDYRGSFLAGTFALHRELFAAVGGYQDGLSYSENTELVLRLLPECRRRGLGVASVERPLLTIHREAAAPVTAEQLAHRLAASELLLSRHREALGRDRRLHGKFLATGAVRAARLGDYRRARRLLRAATLADPTEPRHLARLLVAGVPPLGRRIWPRAAPAGGSKERIRSEEEPARCEP